MQYIEQPTHRDLKKHPENKMHKAAAIKPVVIDESLVDLESLQLAREQGYSGVALKACKGHTEALLMGAAAQKYGMFLCVQDLSCPGYSFLHSASIAARIPTIAAIEGNSRQYCPAGNRALGRSLSEHVPYHRRHGGDRRAYCQRPGILTAEFSMQNPNTLAINGGPAVFPEGPPGWPRPDNAVKAALEAAYADGSWGRYYGPHCERLCESLTASCATQHAWPCCSGTVAVELALRGLKIGPGDEVIVAAYDFPGNFRAIEAVGARPVLVDLAAGTWTLDVEQVAEAASSETKAVIASHLHGSLCNMPRLTEIAAARFGHRRRRLPGTRCRGCR